MSLNREFLAGLALNEPTIQRILEAHQARVDALESAAASQQQALDSLRGEYEGYRRETEAEKTRQQRGIVIRDALRRAGANEQAIPLLAMAVNTTDEDWEGAALRDAQAALAPVREQYAAFFSQPVPLPTDTISPPLDGSALTLEDVRRMSPGEINDNWSLICAALAQRS